MKIIADDRERSSGIIDLLEESGIDVRVKRLSCCDYVINDEIHIERKTGRDFLVSIMDGRLFRQAGVMKKRVNRPIFLVEGNPFNQAMNLSEESIRGAILSLQVIWYLPVLFSKNSKETCNILKFIGKQTQIQGELLTLRHGYRPRKLITRQLYILQGLPHVGPVLAKRMLEHFGSVRNVFRAMAEELECIEGIGAIKAKKICNIIDA